MHKIVNRGATSRRQPGSYIPVLLHANSWAARGLQGRIFQSRPSSAAATLDKAHGVLMQNLFCVCVPLRVIY
jgi:hypothetical protein